MINEVGALVLEQLGQVVYLIMSGFLIFFCHNVHPATAIESGRASNLFEVLTFLLKFKQAFILFSLIQHRIFHIQITIILGQIHQQKRPSCGTISEIYCN